MLEAAAWADNRVNEKLAWHAANTINIHLRPSDRKTPAQLLGIEQEKPKEKTAEEIRSELAEVRRKFSVNK